MDYKPTGVCSTNINVTVSDGIIDKVVFTNGCSGNTQGVSALVAGMKAEDAIARLKGIKCGFKPTSCPDQLALAIEEAMKA
ncbi:MAG: TIGR03905 family TSCPD domain-containing protein [Lachnospiraceae bacterium]|nr:TIGR03905 family TSCPD domain-containing protein [Lachnospiraceae bacterium]